MGAVAIVPARSRSQRFPRKNFALVDGEPLVSHVVKMLKRSGHFDRVIVSIDDPQEQADLASLGAQVHIRGAAASRYEANVAAVCREVLDTLKSKPDVFCCVYATAFRLQAETVTKARETMLEMNAAGVMGVSILRDGARAMVQQESGRLDALFPAAISLSSQELPQVVASNGTFYWVESKAFDTAGHFYVDPLAGFVVPEDEVSDIDYPSDLYGLEVRSKTQRT